MSRRGEAKRPSCSPRAAALAALAVLLAAVPAAAQTVNISGLQDVSFTNVDPTVNATRVLDHTGDR